jgi:hypothetical protein
MGRVVTTEQLAKAKASYMLDIGKSLQDISKEYNINPNTLRTHANREDPTWNEQRKQLQSRLNKRITAEIEKNIPNMVIKDIRNRLIKGSVKALDKIEQIIDGKGGKSSYNSLLASRDWLDRAGFKAPEQLDIKLSKISNVLDKVSITVTDASDMQALPEGTAPEQASTQTDKTASQIHSLDFISPTTATAEEPLQDNSSLEKP